MKYRYYLSYSCITLFAFTTPALNVVILTYALIRAGGLIAAIFVSDYFSAIAVAMGRKIETLVMVRPIGEGL